MTKNFQEECWIIYGFETNKYMYGFLNYESIGSFGSVNFDWEKIFSRRKHLLGFLHTHPSGIKDPSGIDYKTMCSWVKALGKPLICGIKCDHNINFYQFERIHQNEILYYKLFFWKKFNFIKVRKLWI